MSPSLHTKHLRAFVAVARSDSLAQAAQSLRRVPSAVSRALRELEASLDAPLFERGPSRWLLTEAGRVLRRRADLALAEMAAAREALAVRTSPLFALGVHERRLEMLLAFSERKHVSAAARQLRVSQPAVSMALRELETLAGLALFDRGLSGVALNPAGELLTRHVKRALSQLRLAAAEIAATKGSVEGEVVIGALPFGRPYLLPVAIGRVLERHPGLRVRTVEAPLERLVAALRLGDVDFLVGALQAAPREEGLVREELLHEPMVVLARAGHPLAKAKRLRLQDLLRVAWVLPPPGSPTREALLAAFARRSLGFPSVGVASADLSIIRGLLLETDMITAASRHLFHHELRSGALVSLPVRLAGTERPIGILRRTPGHSSPGAQLLIEALRAVKIT